MKKEMISDIMDQINKFRDKYGDKKTVEMFQNSVIKSNNNELCFWFAERFEYVDAKALGKVIINSGNAKDNFEFAHEIKGADIKAHEIAILKSGDPEYNWRFIQYFENADKELHIEAIMKSKNPVYMYYLAYDIDKENFTKYIDPILETKNPEYVFRIAKDITEKRIKGYNLNELEQIVIDSKDAFSNYQWVQTFKKCRFKEHERAVIESKNVTFCQFFASLPGADIRKLGQVIIDSKDDISNFEFALHRKGADIRGHAMVIIKNRKAKYNYDFASMVYEKLDPKEYDKCRDLIEMHAKVVAKSKDLLYNSLFASLPGADKNLHLQAVIDSKSKDKRDNYLLQFARVYKDIDGNKIYDALKSESAKSTLKYILKRDFEDYNCTKNDEIEEQTQKINKLIKEL